jgi:hypothetical protein
MLRALCCFACVGALRRGGEEEEEEEDLFVFNDTIEGN